jgi:hypothetical protein
MCGLFPHVILVFYGSSIGTFVFALGVCILWSTEFCLFVVDWDDERQCIGPMGSMGCMLLPSMVGYIS